MIGSDLRHKRLEMGIAGHLVCTKAGVGRSRLSDIERGYVQPSDVELTRICRALEELISAKTKLAAAAVKVGWPPEAL
jgi:predicted transcriptional regulator